MGLRQKRARCVFLPHHAGGSRLRRTRVPGGCSLFLGGSEPQGGEGLQEEESHLAENAVLSRSFSGVGRWCPGRAHLTGTAVFCEQTHRARKRPRLRVPALASPLLRPRRGPSPRVTTKPPRSRTHQSHTLAGRTQGHVSKYTIQSVVIVKQV
ncbi:hypothetical protein D623_10021610 [Myotis brandtii]|uniref:Uncharacterized protein n=1 Tax=Myotis brandtii TaxID=109478 RepID=S7NU00_MYOBR|nr:hypothetical protein D623_10021610 [Myotis brandtii]